MTLPLGYAERHGESLPQHAACRLKKNPSTISNKHQDNGFRNFQEIYFGWDSEKVMVIALYFSRVVRLITLLTGLRG